MFKYKKDQLINMNHTLLPMLVTATVAKTIYGSLRSPWAVSGMVVHRPGPFLEPALASSCRVKSSPTTKRRGEASLANGRTRSNKKSPKKSKV